MTRIDSAAEENFERLGEPQFSVDPIDGPPAALLNCCSNRMRFTLINEGPALS